jgi:hypothetical protein
MAANIKTAVKIRLRVLKNRLFILIAPLSWFLKLSDDDYTIKDNRDDNNNGSNYDDSCPFFLTHITPPLRR